MIGEPLTVCLFDGVRLRGRHRTIELGPGSGRLVALVALAAPRPVQRGRVAAALWPDVPDERAAANVRSTLFRLRRDHPGLVVTTGTSLRIGERVRLDIDHPLDHIDLTRGALPTLLPNWDEDWIELERERVRQRLLRAVETRCAELIAEGNTPEAIDLGLLAVAAEPLRESSWEVVLRAHIADGNLCEAGRLLLAHERLVLAEFGVTPSEHLYRLIDDATLARSHVVPSSA